MRWMHSSSVSVLFVSTCYVIIWTCVRNSLTHINVLVLPTHTWAKRLREKEKWTSAPIIHHKGHRWSSLIILSIMNSLRWIIMPNAKLPQNLASWVKLGTYVVIWLILGCSHNNKIQFNSNLNFEKYTITRNIQKMWSYSYTCELELIYRLETLDSNLIIRFLFSHRMQFNYRTCFRH